MSTTMRSVTHTRSPGRGDWKETLGRVGLAGKGVLYVVIGILAVQLAMGDSADASQKGAIEWIGGQPFGRFLLVALTVSLFALAAWRFLDALVGDPVEGSETSDRVKYLAKGVTYLVFAVIALTVTIANWSRSGSDSGGQAGAGGGGGDSGQQATAAVLDWPAGPWIVGLVGVAIIAYTVYEMHKQVVEQEYLERLDVGEHSWIARFGRLGYLARGAVYLLVGYFLVHAAVAYDPAEAKGLSQTLQTLAGEGWGRLVLWLVAAGLVAYGVFSLAESKHRRAA